jgi:hypothetical protein
MGAAPHKTYRMRNHASHQAWDRRNFPQFSETRGRVEPFLSRGMQISGIFWPLMVPSITPVVWSVEISRLKDFEGSMLATKANTIAHFTSCRPLSPRSHPTNQNSEANRARSWQIESRSTRLALLGAVTGQRHNDQANVEVGRPPWTS